MTLHCVSALDLALSLFVLWFLTYHTNDSLTADDDTFITDLLDGWADFHTEKS